MSCFFRAPLAAKSQRCPRRACGLLGGLLLAAGQGAWASFDPTQMSLEALMDTPVVGASKYAQAQTRVAAAVSVITREDIRRHGWRTLGQALSSLPGFHTSYDRQYTHAGTRGLALPEDYNTRLLITLNGLRLNEPTYDSVMAGPELPVDLDLIERIEVIPGPGGAVHGQNALFGVVNLVTRRGADLDGTELSAGWTWPQQTRHARLSTGGQTEQGTDFLLSASTLRSAGEDRFYDYGLAGSGMAAGMDGERDDELFLRLAGTAWSWDLSLGDRRKDDPTAAGNVDPLTPGTYIRDRYLQSQLQLEHDWDGGRQQLLARFSLGAYRFSSAAHYGGEAYWFTGSGDARGLDLRWVNSAFAAHRFMLGVEWQDLPRQDQSGEYLPDPFYSLFYRTQGWRAGVYAQDEWQLTDRLVATLGLRADRSPVNGTHFNPRLALIWQPDTSSTYKLLYGRAHRSPNAYERDWRVTDDNYPVLLPAIRPERIDTLEWVADRRLSPDWSVRASAYHWVLQDLIRWNEDAFAFVSAPRVTARGLELSMNRVWASGPRLRGSLSWQDARRRDGAPLPNTPRWMAKVHAGLPLPAGWQAGLEALAEGARFDDSGQRRRGPVLLNLHLLSGELQPGVRVALGVQNLLDQRVRQPLGPGEWMQDVEQDGRSLSLKMEARF